MISSFRTASQLSCSVSISSLSNAFCSSVRPATHFSLSNFRAGAVSVGPLDGFVDDVDELVLGGPKKLVIELFALGFLASAATMSAALRLRDMIKAVKWKNWVVLEEGTKALIELVELIQADAHHAFGWVVLSLTTECG